MYSFDEINFDYILIGEHEKLSLNLGVQYKPYICKIDYCIQMVCANFEIILSMLPSINLICINHVNVRVLFFNKNDLTCQAKKIINTKSIIKINFFK